MLPPHGMPKFLRKFFRRHMNPLTPNEAWDKRRSWAFWYMISGWTFVGFLAIAAWKKQQDIEKDTPAYQFYAEKYGSTNVKVIHMTGLAVTGVTDMNEQRQGRNVKEAQASQSQKSSVETGEKIEIMMNTLSDSKPVS